jgi:hypothetical protein
LHRLRQLVVSEPPTETGSVSWGQPVNLAGGCGCGCPEAKVAAADYGASGPTRKAFRCASPVNAYVAAALGLGTLAAIVRLTTMALALWFLRWLIKTGAENERVLRLAIPILKALPGLLREDRRWAAPSDS